MSANTLVSIIMPAYNCEKTLHYAVESVLEQTLSEWELILINDASTDATYEIMWKYYRKDNRIRLYRNMANSRQGPIEWEPRNQGLHVLSGALVAYLDADNAWRPEFLERLSNILTENNQLQIAYCDSCNHYSEEETEKVIRLDKRKLIDSGPTWAVFSNTALDLKRLGVEQYVDTNEMMHRASTFSRLNCLWRTFHPRRKAINENQVIRCPYRRHNDLDLFERIVEAYGSECVMHLHEVHVDFFYPSADRTACSNAPATVGLDHNRSTNSAIHPQTKLFLNDLNHAHFRRNYLVGLSEPYGLSDSAEHELGPGEIGYVEGLDLPTLYKEFITEHESLEVLTRYDCTKSLRSAYRVLAEGYNTAIGNQVFSEFSIAPCDGCHNALYNAVCMFTGTAGCAEGRDSVAFAVPSYPYWTTVSAARRLPCPIEAYEPSQMLAELGRLRDDRIGAVILTYPGNPIGNKFNVDEVIALGQMAREQKWGIIVDITYSEFLGDSEPLAPLLELPFERTIICDSVSKAWGLPGLRLGYCLAADVELAAALRANKSGESLLPSALKQMFISHLMVHYPEIPGKIVAAINDRKKELRGVLRKDLMSECYVKVSSDMMPGPYEILYIRELCEYLEQSPSEIAEALLGDTKVHLLSSDTFFPKCIDQNARKPFLRLSVGKSCNIALAGAAILEGLQCQVSKRLTKCNQQAGNLNELKL